MPIAAKEHQLIIDIATNLAYSKRDFADYILSPAGVPKDIYKPLMNKADQFGKQLSKRQMAPLLLEALDHRPSCAGIPQRIIVIAASWDRWHLAKDADAARATVARAKEALGTVKHTETQDLELLERRRKEVNRRKEQERALAFRNGLSALLTKFEEMQRSNDYQGRGYGLENLLGELFALFQLELQAPFRRNSGGEQIDGAFSLDSNFYLVECRWRGKPADTAQVDAFRSKVERGSKQTMGLFLSVNGWSSHVPDIMKRTKDMCVVLMDGVELYGVLSDRARLPELLRFKARRLAIHGEPFANMNDFLSS
jgi:hypothetical protein